MKRPWRMLRSPYVMPTMPPAAQKVIHTTNDPHTVSQCSHSTIVKRHAVEHDNVLAAVIAPMARRLPPVAFQTIPPPHRRLAQ